MIYSQGYPCFYGAIGCGYVVNSKTKKLIETISHEELAWISRTSMKDQELFDSQRRFYDAVSKPQKKVGYYDDI